MLRLLLIGWLSLVLFAPVEARLAVVPADWRGGQSWLDPIPLQEARQREPGPADLKEAIEIALERYGGEAADAQTVVREGRRVHEVRILLEDGSVRTVRIDPDTGAILPPPRER
jgi:hypothetical protein